MTEYDLALQGFVVRVEQVPDVISVDVVKGYCGNDCVVVVVPNIFNGASWEVTKIQCHIEDLFPSVTLDVRVQSAHNVVLPEQETAGSHV